MAAGVIVSNSGRRFQPQNLKRPDEDLDIETAIDIILSADFDLMSVMYEQPLGVVADILRGLLIAAPGHRILAADYSNIEGRVLAWLAGEHWKVQAFKEFDEGHGADLYIKSYAETFNVPLFDKKDPRRQVGKVMELASGYQGGHGAYLKFGMTGAKLDNLTEIIRSASTEEEWEAAEKKFNGGHGLSKEHWTALRITIDRWRAKHAAVAAFWGDMEQAAIDAVQNRGQAFKVGKVTFKVSGSSLTMKLPSGRHFFYARPEIRMIDLPWDERDPVWVDCATQEEADVYGDKLVEFNQEKGCALVFVPARKPGLTYMSEIDDSRRGRIVPDKMNNSKYARIKTYGGSIVENCLAGDTPVLTARGWVSLLEVSRSDLLWDGEQWVGHDGLIFKGMSDYTSFGGFKVTADHKILTPTGWVEAGSTSYAQAASSSPRFDGTAFWLPNNSGAVRKPKWEDLLVGGLRLRQSQGSSGFRANAQAWIGAALLWLQNQRECFQGKYHSRDVTPQTLCGVERHYRPLSASYASCVPQLRRAGHKSVRALAVVREFLRGCVAYVRGRPDPGSVGQQQRVQPGQLPVGELGGTGKQQAGQRNHSDARGAYDRGQGVESIRRECNHNSVPDKRRLAGELSSDPAGLHEPNRRLIPVYDILNAGPRHRFVVRGADRRMVIVSNCVQAVARDILVEAMPKLEAAGYPIILTVHDEIVCEVSDGHGSVEEMEAIMCDLPAWAKGLPVAAEGFEDRRYRK